MNTKVIAFRPDAATARSLSHIKRLRPKVDTSAILREAVQTLERAIEMERIVAACRAAGDRNVAIVEEFEAAGDA